MRFTSPRDYQTIVKLNKELINIIVDTNVIIYKLHQTLTKTNSYNEATQKTWYTGVTCPALIKRGDSSASSELNTVDVKQEATFNFLLQELVDRNIYPESGDIIVFDEQYYEIHNTAESQLFAGRTEYQHSIVCDCHLSRNTNLQLEPPII